ncbi:MAG: hypothetical protein RMJ98_11785 [Myxococcales bacterium]|nr:hypothetical protein [Polyangiaceae bacterium]MDW8249968.1 hypothetical protein [Myxococcales bacterium]
MNVQRAVRWALWGTVGVLHATNAMAQEEIWLNDEQLVEGRGVQRNRLRYTGGLAAALGYDSNVFLRSGSADERRGDAFTIKITPFIRINTQAPDQAPEQATKSPYALSASASLSYLEFIQGPTQSGRPTEDLTSHRNFGFTSNLRLRIAPDARWGGELHGSATRTIQPSNLGDPTATFNRTNPSLGGTVVWTPGGGLFVWKVIGYDMMYNYFEADRFQRYNNFNHIIRSNANWQILPQTSLFGDSRLIFIRYTNPTEQNDGDVFAARVGVNSLLTYRFGFLTALGWTTSVFESKNGAPRQDFDRLMAHAEARFFLSSPPKNTKEVIRTYPTKLTIGYIRDSNQSYIGNFYNRDRAYMALYYFFAHRVRSTIQFSVAHLGFPATYFEDGTPRDTPFSSLAVGGTLFMEYLPRQHVGLFVNGDYMSQITDKPIRVNRFDPTITDDLGFHRFRLTLGLRYLL